jgi:hypothetical protein
MIKKKGVVEVKNQTKGYMTAALGLVAGLAWNDAIKSLIETFFPLDKSSIWLKFVYAFLVTLVVVGITRYILKPDQEEN